MDENEIPHDENSVADQPWSYTHGHSDAVLRSHRWRTAENSAAYLLASLQPGMRVLDVGCGPGTLTADLAARVAPGETIGIDLASEVVAEAGRVGAGRASNLSFAVADVHTLQPRSPGFDVVHAHQVLQHVADPVATLRAMSALCADDGLVAARDADYSAMIWWPHEPMLDRWLQIYRAVTRRNGAECDAGRQLLNWANNAGLTDVRYTTSTWTFASAVDLAWWCDLWAERIVASRLAEQAVEFGIAEPDELVQVAAAWRRWGTQTDAVFIVPHGEITAHPARRA